MATKLDTALSFYAQFKEPIKKLVGVHLQKMSDRYRELDESYSGVENLLERQELDMQFHELVNNPVDYWSFYGTPAERNLVLPEINKGVSDLYLQAKSLFLSKQFDRLASILEDVKPADSLLRKDGIYLFVPGMTAHVRNHYAEIEEEDSDIFEGEQLVEGCLTHKEELVLGLKESYKHYKKGAKSCSLYVDYGAGKSLKNPDGAEMFNDVDFKKFVNQLNFAFNTSHRNLYSAAATVFSDMKIDPDSSLADRCLAYVYDFHEKIFGEYLYFGNLKETSECGNKIYEVTPGEFLDFDDGKLVQACERFGGVRREDKFLFVSEQRAISFLKSQIDPFFGEATKIRFKQSLDKSIDLTIDKKFRFGV